MIILNSLNNNEGRKILTILKKISTNHKKYKNAFYMSSYGEKNSMNFDIELSFILGGNKYEIKQALFNSDTNVYFSSNVYLNDKKANILAINKLI